jgi:hypothetical protein
MTPTAQPDITPPPAPLYSDAWFASVISANEAVERQKFAEWQQIVGALDALRKMRELLLIQDAQA